MLIKNTKGGGTGELTFNYIEALDMLAIDGVAYSRDMFSGFGNLIPDNLLIRLAERNNRAAVIEWNN